MASHLALYRKYRPTSFAELVGQEPVAVTLSRAVEQGRVSHAYLFCGPRGTGKTSVARILARSLNCEQGPTLTPCGQCVACQGMATGQALDVIEIDAASNNGVDNIRELQDRVGLAPVGGKHKIYIIDEVHMLSGGAFNALLKTLEEPPARVIFILATTDPHKVLPTIISRCQRHDFARIPSLLMVEHLRAIALKESITIDDEALTLVARRAQGGLRDALSLLDQLAAAAGTDALTGSRAAELLGMLRVETIEALGAAVLARDAATALLQAQQCLLAGAEHGAVIRELMRYLRDRLVLALSPEQAENLDIPASTRDRLLAEPCAASPTELMWMLESLKDTDAMIRRSPQGALWLDFGLLRVCMRSDVASIRTLTERVAALEAALANGGVETLPVAAPAPVRSPVAPVPQPTAIPASVLPPVPPPTVKLPEFPAPPRPPASPLVHAPAEAPAAPPASTAPEPAMPSTPGVGTGARPLPPHAWERIQERVRVKSVPTAALLGQQASIDHWAPDGALIIRMPKPFKDQFDRQTSKRDLLNQSITSVLGPGAFARLETIDAKNSVRRAIPVDAPPVPSPVSQPAPIPGHSFEPPEPAPATQPPVIAAPVTAEGSQAEPAAPMPAHVDNRGTVSSETAMTVEVSRAAPSDRDWPGEVRLVKDIFNGRVVPPM